MEFIMRTIRPIIQKKKARKLSKEEIYNTNIYACRKLSNNLLPSFVINAAFERFVELVVTFTGLTADHFSYEKNFLSMYKLTMLPFEPKLYGILVKPEIEKKHLFFHLSRTDSIEKYRAFREKFDSLVQSEDENASDKAEISESDLNEKLSKLSACADSFDIDGLDRITRLSFPSCLTSWKKMM